jgi:hypothetical protein
MAKVSVRDFQRERKEILQRARRIKEILQYRIAEKILIYNYLKRNI